MTTIQEISGSNYESWGRFPKVDQKAFCPQWRSDVASYFKNKQGDSGSTLPFGQGRSYGDVCLNGGGSILSSQNLRNFISFDDATGLLICEAGVTLEEIINFGLPNGYFLPVSPGTKYVSLGGAIANDIHGKNHHVAGTFGRHVPKFGLVRSDGQYLECSEDSNPEMYRATIGGLGLTGFIVWAALQLKPVKNSFIDMDSIKFGGLDEFFEISKKSDKDFEYTVAWIDCLASGDSLGRGIFMRGNHLDKPKNQCPKEPFKPKLIVPIDAPSWALNHWSVKAFNFAFYNKQINKEVRKTVHYDPFFYPLDSVLAWNKIYGKRGFIQFQCVVPSESGHTKIREILKVIAESGRASFLAVLKEFGTINSPGILSFPRPGTTLCLDFPFEGDITKKLYERLEAIVNDADGALYPAKDPFMTPESFTKYYPQWKEFSKYIDPGFSSSFWRRVAI